MGVFLFVLRKQGFKRGNDGGRGREKEEGSALFRLPPPSSISRLTSVLLPRSFVLYFMNHKHQKLPATLVKVDLQSATKQVTNEMGYTCWNEQFDALPTPS